MRWTKWDGSAKLACVGWLRERERELEAIEALLERPGRVALVEGRVGIGKTSLIAVACSRADDRGRWLRGMLRMQARLSGRP